MLNWLRRRARRFLRVEGVQGSSVSVRGAPIAPVQGGPIVSFVLVVYKMPEQARNTVRSLLPEYQRGVSAGAYEVLIVENRSEHLMEISSGVL